MRAIVRDRDGVKLALVTAPAPGPDEVVVEIAYAGVGRSDLAVADGTIVVSPGRVLGHELAGRVRQLGAAVTDLAVGDPVTVVPFSPCGVCASCGAGHRCPVPIWLGLARDGAFADRVRVPASMVLRLPPGLTLRRGACAEPIAAALGVLPYVERGARVLIVGHGRSAELTARVCAAHGAAVVRDRDDDIAFATAGFDVAIEHGGELSALLPLLRPGGSLILRSRSRRLALDASELAARDLLLRAASHGSFEAAIDWLRTGKLAIDDLLAPARPLESFAQLLAAERTGDSHKQMFAVAPGLERG
jgi:threonine dehydrogenase-like Zn-dependent dehydrogenase